jgi:Arc/MetJ-type ribon-helix-helix transcriptional regulator
MAKTKPRGKYQAVSLPYEFVEVIRKHVLNNPKYRSIAEFVKTAIINQLEREK